MHVDVLLFAKLRTRLAFVQLDNIFKTLCIQNQVRSETGRRGAEQGRRHRLVYPEVLALALQSR